MTARRQRREQAQAAAVSLVLHVVFVLLMVTGLNTEYPAEPDNTTPPPDTVAPPIKAEIIHLPKPKAVKIEAAPKPEPQPEPERAPPTSAQVAAAKQQPPPPLPALPKPQPPAPPAPTQARTPPKPTPLPAPAPARPTPPTPAKPTPPQLAPPAPAAPPAPKAPPLKLNIHKPKEEAPGYVQPLPMAPAPTPAAPPVGSSAPGSRLGAIQAWPSGTFPNGGPGLRGSLVGCANASAARLSATEQARCAERFGQDIHHAPALDPIDAAKRAAYDRAVAREEAKRAYRAGTVIKGAPSDIGGGVATGPSSAVNDPNNVPHPPKQ